jgi:hypothetical protein
MQTECEVDCEVHCEVECKAEREVECEVHCEVECKVEFIFLAQASRSRLPRETKCVCLHTYFCERFLDVVPSK